MAQLRRTESIAGRYYWQTFAHHRSGSSLVGGEACLTTGTRPVRGLLATQRPNKSAQGRPDTRLRGRQLPLRDPRSEATIAAYRMGFDPALGLMHADKRYRPSLVSDLMEPARPAADAIAVELLSARELRRGEVFETRKGVCRLGPSLARELAAHAAELGTAVAPNAERLARLLLRAPGHPTPLTRRRHKAAVRAPR